MFNLHRNSPYQTHQMLLWAQQFSVSPCPHCSWWWWRSLWCAGGWFSVNWHQSTNNSHSSHRGQTIKHLISYVQLFPTSPATFSCQLLTHIPAQPRIFLWNYNSQHSFTCFIINYCSCCPVHSHVNTVIQNNIWNKCWLKWAARFIPSNALRRRKHR